MRSSCPCVYDNKEIQSSGSVKCFKRESGSKHSILLYAMIVKIEMTLITRKHQICARVIAVIVIAQVAVAYCKFVCLDADGILYRH